MVYIQNNAVNQVWLGINEWATLSNPTYLFQLENSQGRDSVYFIPRNITANYPDSYANKYLVFEFETFLGNPIQLRATGATDCNIHLKNENQYWLYIWEQPQGDGNLNPLNATNKVFNELAFIFVDVNNTYYTGNTANFADNVIYYSQGTTPPPSPSPSSTLPSPSTSLTPTPSITPTITPTLTNTPTITPTETLTPTPTPSSDLRFRLGDGFDTFVRSMAMDIQNDLIVGGDFNFYKNSGGAHLVNLDFDGDRLGGFASGFNFPSAPNNINCIKIDNSDPNNPTGYIGGSLFEGNQYSGVSSPNFVQINSETGELVNLGDFATLNLNATVNDILLSGNSVFIGGVFTTTSGTTQNRFTKISKLGVLDTTFKTNMGSGFNGNITGVDATIDKGLICVGSPTSYNGTARNRIFKLNANGILDTSFLHLGGFNAQPNGVKVLSDGRILAWGGYSSYNGASTNRITMMSSGGTYDFSFSAPASIGTQVFDITIDETNGWIYFLSNGLNIGGNANIDYFGRLDFSGVLDSTFPAQPLGFGSPPSSGKGRIIISGSKIFLGSNFTTFGSQQYNYLIRLNQDGTSDTRTDI